MAGGGEQEVCLQLTGARCQDGHSPAGYRDVQDGLQGGVADVDQVKILYEVTPLHPVFSIIFKLQAETSSLHNPRMSMLSCTVDSRASNGSWLSESMITKLPISYDQCLLTVSLA